MSRDDELLELRALVARLTLQLSQQAEELAALRADNETLRATNAALLEKLNRHSGNSHKPPSSDGPGARSKRPDKRKGKKRKRGGQPGHKGSSRALLPAEEVDKFVDLYPSQCESCWASLPQTPDAEARRHQQTELPPIRPLTTEWRRHAVTCGGCGYRTRAGFDPAVIPATAFGPRLTALSALLTGSYHLSRRTAQGMLQDVFGVSMSLGALSANEQRVTTSLQSAVAEAWEQVLVADVKHTDGTSWSERHQYCALWVLACSTATVFKILADGSRASLRPLYGEMTGILVSDRASTLTFWAMDKRQICWAHLLRKFISFAERKERRAAELGLALADCTGLLFSHWRAYQAGVLSEALFRQWMAPLQTMTMDLLQRVADANIPRMSGSCADILAHKDALWTFIDSAGVEPTNNHAERELRGFVLWRKRSFGTQSQRGNRFAESIMTVVHTARKQGLNVLGFVTECYQAFIRALPTPSLFEPACDILSTAPS